MKPLLSVLLLLLLGPAGAYGQAALRLVEAPRKTAAVATPERARTSIQADTTVVYDSGTVAVVTVEEMPRDEIYEVGQEARQANRFVTPPEGRLVGVAVAPYYLDDFEGTTLPDSVARDFRLTIWAGDGAGGPGDAVLFTLDVTDDRANTDAGGRFTFLDVDLTPYQDQLDALPDTFYVGLTNAGDDSNDLVMGVSDYTGANVAFLYRLDFFDGQGGWRPFPAIFSPATGAALEDRVLPIRASFLVPDQPTASENATELPHRIALHPNFPNPFNPTTTIAYDLDRSADVRLAVYDLLGRRLALLVDAVQPAGTYQVALEAGRWASGVYVYTLEAGGTRQSRRMVLLK